jgi:hypothetical protein
MRGDPTAFQWGLLFTRFSTPPFLSGRPIRFETMPSRPIRQACRKIRLPSPVIASLSSMPPRSAFLLREDSG